MENVFSSQCVKDNTGNFFLDLEKENPKWTKTEI